MTDYAVKFIGQIVESKRPSGQPDKVHCFIVVRADKRSELNTTIQNEFSRFLKQNGMLVLKDPESTQMFEVDFDNMIFIPMHMFASIVTEIKVLTSPIQLEGEDEGVILH